MLKKFALIVLMLMMIPGNAHAADLTASDIERFIQTYKDMLPHLDDLDDDFYDNDDGNSFNIQTLRKGFLDAVSKQKNLQSIIKKHGYSSNEKFAEESAYIMRAYISVSAMEGFREFEKSISEMSPDEQQIFKDMPFYQSFMETKAMISDIPPAHTKAIEPYVQTLNVMFNIDDEDDEHDY